MKQNTKENTKESIREKLYKYSYKGEYYYAQGIYEQYVRVALATKLDIDPDELTEGISDLPEQEIHRVCTSSLNYRGLDNSLGYRESAKTSVNKIKSKTGYTSDFIKSKISHYLNIPRKIVDSLNDDEVISSIKRHSNTKIKVKTHKICNTTPDDIHNINKEVVISRVDELNNHINMLLARDYNIFFEIDDVEYELARSEASYNNLASTISSLKQSHKDYNSKVERASELLKQINSYKELISMKHNRYYSTGYYVSDSYLHDNYDEVMQGFAEIYNKLKIRMLRGNLNNIIPIGEEFTLEEKLNSFMLYEEA